LGYQTGNITKAVQSLLNNDSTLVDLVPNIYVMRVPKNASYPCIVIGSNYVPSVPLNVFGKKGRTTSYPVMIYGSSRSISQAVAIAERVDTLLDEQGLTITGNNHICTQIKDDALGYDGNAINDKGVNYIYLNYRIETDET
jgi:hypothetical protein